MSLKLNLARFLSRKLLGYEVNVLTFSQAGEDIIIRNFFFDRLSRGEKGFFVDIGAFHPYRHSNTYYLYRGGWRGINIDARPNSMRLFNKLRPDDTNLELALSDGRGFLTYLDFGDASANMNSMSSEYVNKLGIEHEVVSRTELPTYPLREVLENYVPKGVRVDYMNIDVEGMELPILSSNDWTRFRPSLISSEVYGCSLTEIANDPVSCLLISNDYEIYARVILEVRNVNTVFYVDSSDTN